MKFIKDLGLIETGRIRSDTGNPEKKRYYLAECECGKQKQMLMSDFKRRPDSTCKECSGRRNATKHGKRFTRLYSIYMGMKYRCYNQKAKDYQYYGANNITICEEWLKDFEVFEEWALQNGYEDKLSIDRIENGKGYSPTNCRWVDQTIQGQNSRVLRSTNTSGYRGVKWVKTESKWSATITVSNERIFLGYFDTALEAAQAYDTYVVTNNLEHNHNNTLEQETNTLETSNHRSGDGNETQYRH